MALTLTELIDSRRWTLGESPSLELKYLIEGSSSDYEVRVFALANLPSSFSSMKLDNIDIDPINVDSVGKTGRWAATGRYSLPDQVEESFDTTGGTFHLTHSRVTTGAFNRNGAHNAQTKNFVPNHHGAIGVTDDSITGVDIPAPVYNFTETHLFQASVITPAFKGVIFNLNNRINNGRFRAFNPGECRFDGATGTKRAGGLFEVRYHFSASPNQVGIRIGTEILVDKKRGWDYLWVQYEKKDDEDAKSVVRRPTAAYVEVIFLDGDFSSLGIGTGDSPPPGILRSAPPVRV